MLHPRCFLQGTKYASARLRIQFHGMFDCPWFRESFLLALPACISDSCIKVKFNLKFYFHISLRRIKRFYEGLIKISKIHRKTPVLEFFANFYNAFMKPSEAKQKSVKIKI